MAELPCSNITIVIPVYNNPGTLRDVVTRSLAVHDNVCVVDDGSDVSADELLHGLSVKIIRHEKNRGKGAAILTGAREAAKLGMTNIITIDADGQHNPEDLPRFIKAAAADPHAIIVGRRQFEHAQVPGASVFGRSFSNFWMRLQTGKSVGDTQSGFRAYPIAVLDHLRLRERHFSFEVEVLVKAAWAGIDILDLDISVYYPPEEKRISHFRGIVDNLRLTVLNTKLTLRSIAPIPHRKIHIDYDTGQAASMLHPVKSLKGLLTKNITPGKLAFAAGLGVFLGALPLIACHTVVIILATGFLGLNRVAAIGASQITMPPIVPALCIEAGYFMRNGRFLTEISIDTIGHQALQRLYEWLIGSLIVGPILGIVTGLIVYMTAVLITQGKRAFYL